MLHIKRPAKRKFNPFIDEMAIVDDDEDDDEDDEEYGREGTEKNKTRLINQYID